MAISEEVKEAIAKLRRAGLKRREFSVQVEHYEDGGELYRGDVLIIIHKETHELVDLIPAFLGANLAVECIVNRFGRVVVVTIRDGTLMCGQMLVDDRRAFYSLRLNQSDAVQWVADYLSKKN